MQHEKMIRASILGGVDGVITSFAIVAGSSAGGLDMNAVLVVGASSVLADGMSMGVSEYLSSTAERALLQGENHGSRTRRGTTSPGTLGIACFVSFVMCGIVPIALFIATNGALLACASFSLVQLMLLGAVRTYYTRETLIWGLLQTSLLGAAAGSVAYGAGRVAHALKP